MTEAGTLPRRFYALARATENGAGFGVALDERSLKTPACAAFIVPTRTLADACAAEWAAQIDVINPRFMPLTQLAFAAIDRTPGHRSELIAQLMKYAETDLIAHRAEAPPALVARQTSLWDPLSTWGASIGVALPRVKGVIAAPVDARAQARVRALGEALDDFALTAAAHAAAAAGSVLVALGLHEGFLGAAEAYAIAALDEEWSLETWGEDGEARARLDRLKSEFQNLGRFNAALAGV